MFLVHKRGIIPSCIKGLYNRLPPNKQRLVEVDGSVSWMLSHPKQAARVVCEWFDDTAGIKGKVPPALRALFTHSTLRVHQGAEIGSGRVLVFLLPAMMRLRRP
jgi:hypothetical protein